MSETIHGTVLNYRDVRVANGRLRIVVFNDAQEFNIEPATMVDLGIQLIKEGHRRIIMDAKHNESVIESLWDQIHELTGEER